MRRIKYDNVVDVEARTVPPAMKPSRKVPNWVCYVILSAVGAVIGLNLTFSGRQSASRGKPSTKVAWSTTHGRNVGNTARPPGEGSPQFAGFFVFFFMVK